MIMNLLLTQNDFTSRFKVLPIEAFHQLQGCMKEKYEEWFGHMWSKTVQSPLQSRDHRECAKIVHITIHCILEYMKARP